jgi:PAS domain S-box-containing protein
MGLGDGPGRSAGGPTAPFDLATELGRDLAAVDWAASAVGAWQNWPAALTNTVQLMTGSRFSMWMAWGEQLTFFCNDAYRRDTLGAKYPWALGKPAAQVWSEIWDDIHPLITSVMTTGVATYNERMQLFLERSGYTEETYHTFSYSPIRGESGEIAGMLCVVSEDTGRVISERRIALLRDLGGALSGAAQMSEVGAAAQRQLGTDPHDLPFTLAYLFDPDGVAQLFWATGLGMGSTAAAPVVAPGATDALWHDALYAGAAQHSAAQPFVTDLAHVPNLPTGGWHSPPAQALSVPLRRVGERGPYGYLIVGLNPFRALDDDYRDFVDLIGSQVSASIARAMAFENERERVEQLAELDRAKTTFFTNVSHELRTPLTLLLGPAEDALADHEHPLEPTQRRRMEVVQRNGERLLKLVNTLLDFSRLESGRVEATYEPLDLDRYTVELASMFESAYERAGLRLTIESAPLRERPFVDREMWSKIVMNLLSNALKATFQGGVTVRLRDAGEAVELEIADTGVGIPPPELGKLFERFHRVNGAQLRSHEGSGVGLALVAELARLHGGSVTVESEVGTGSTFRVRIPLGKEHLDGDRVLDRVVDDIPEIARFGSGYLAEALRWLGADVPTEPASDDDRTSVLVVDDNADMREYVHDLLAGEYAVRTAPNGVVALASIRADPPDLVLTDVMMPELDGFGLLAAIRADPEIAHLPVVMLSARSGDESTIEGLEAGADDYLVKPFAARELLARVRANLELDRVRQLVDELERYRKVLDHAEELAHVGSWEVDLHANTTRLSPEVRRIMGFGDTEQIPWDAALQLAVAEDRDKFRRAVDEAVATGRSFDTVVRAARPNGDRFLARVRGAALRDETGAVTVLRGSTQDITDQRATELAMARAEADREAAAREHAIASELQQSLLPPPTFAAEQLEIAAFYRAGVEGTQVGGDWHDVIDLGDGRTALVIGDVMGRGVRAAAVMGQLRAAVRAYARLDLPPGVLIRLLDDTVREISEDTIVTCVYAVYDPAEHTLDYANAGHLPPLLVDAEHGARRLLVGGPPLGAGQHRSIDERVPLGLGTMLVLYTDGLVERRGSNLDTGIDALAQLVATTKVPIGQLPVALVDRLLPEGPEDDVAILVCRASDNGSHQRTARHDVGQATGSLTDARRFVSRTLEGWGVGGGSAFDILLCVSELVTNAINHGGRPIQVRLHLYGDRLQLEVRDGGAGMPAMRLSEPDEASGRGLLIVSRLAERWGIRPGAPGKTVWAQFLLARARDRAVAEAQ